MSERAGALCFDQGFWAEPAEVQRQVVVAALGWLTGAAYAPRATEVERLMVALRGGRDATLAGCRARKGWLMREPRAVGGPVAVGEPWDGRWVSQGPGRRCVPLGPRGCVRCRAGGKRAAARGASGDAGLWQGATLLAAPEAGLSAGWTVRLPQPFTLRR